MKLITFFTNGSKQVINLHESFFRSDKKDKKDNKNVLLTSFELHQKAKLTSQSIAEEHYYNHHLDYDKIDLEINFQ